LQCYELAQQRRHDIGERRHDIGERRDNVLRIQRDIHLPAATGRTVGQVAAAGQAVLEDLHS
jgi:hypothetical protein